MTFSKIVRMITILYSIITVSDDFFKPFKEKSCNFFFAKQNNEKMLAFFQGLLYNFFRQPNANARYAFCGRRLIGKREIVVKRVAPLPP